MLIVDMKPKQIFKVVIREEKVQVCIKGQCFVSEHERCFQSLAEHLIQFQMHGCMPPD